MVEEMTHVMGRTMGRGPRYGLLHKSTLLGLFREQHILYVIVDKIIINYYTYSAPRDISVFGWFIF